MDLERIKIFFEDARYITLFPRRYKTRRGMGEDYWRDVNHRLEQVKKMVDGCSWHWYVIEFKDGHRETTRLRVLKGGFFSGMYPALYRGAVYPRMVDISTFDHINEISLAF